MKKTAKLGMALVAVVALPVALATEWVTHKEVAELTRNEIVRSDIMKVSDSASNIPPAENVANEMKIYASF